MASEDYLPLFRKARREHLGNIARGSAEIIKLYREAAADLAARAAASRKGSLTERWAAEYAESLKRRVRELEAGLYDVTLQGLKRSAELPSEAMGEWWKAVGGQSFRDAFATTPDSVLVGIIEGGFYKDNKGLSERIWRVADSFEKDVGYIVNRGIAEKKSALELARDLEQYVKLPAKRDFDWGKVYPNLSGEKVDYNAQRLARTSINHAYFLGNVKVCTENPFVTAMHWDLSNAHEERQVIPFGPDECDEYAAHDEGLGEGNWKPEEIPVPHPQCLCVQWAVIPQSLEDIGAQIGRWASGEPDELLDEWYEKYGSRNPNGDPKEILRGSGGSSEYRGLPSRVKDVKNEYEEKATPGKGSILYDPGYEIGKHRDEIAIAEWLLASFGGDIRLLAEDEERKVKTPDYEWNGDLWELKSKSSINAIDAGVRLATKQIASNPGGIIIDCRASNLTISDSEKIVSTISNRLSRSGMQTVDVIILFDDTDDGTMIVRYK